MKYYLVADIGGTNPRIAMLDSNSNILKKKDLSHENLVNQINNFLKYCGEENLTTDTLCIAAAGPVKNGKCILTNVKLIINPEEIRKNSYLKNVYLINDFEAIGYEVNNYSESHLIKDGVLQPGNKLVIGPGTGLGCCLITKGGEVIPTESCFLELNFENTNKEITADDLLSGPGIEYIYKNHFHKQVPAKEAIKEPIVQSIFTKSLAKFTKNLSFSYLPYGGIYLVGGVLQKNPKLLDDIFRKEYITHNDKDIQDMLKQIPIFLIKDYDISLHGCLSYILSQKQ